MGDLLSYPLSSLARSDKSGWLLQFWLSLQSENQNKSRFVISGAIWALVQDTVKIGILFAFLSYFKLKTEMNPVE